MSFHRFPKDGLLRKKWIVAVKRDEGNFFTVAKSTVVCSKHFVDGDFVRNVANGHGFLLPDAVPAVFTFKKRVKLLPIT